MMRNHRGWRLVLSDLMVLTGVLALAGAGLAWAQVALAALPGSEARYLVADVPPVLPVAQPGAVLPGAAGAVQGQAAPELHAALGRDEAQVEQASELDASAQVWGKPDRLLFVPLILTAPEQADSPAPGAPQDPGFVATSRVVRLVIPSLNIDRAVAPVPMRKDGQWDTDRLFATQNRSDLVGQMAISTNPGDGGNVILLGHNYDEGVFQWEGVFVGLKQIQPGAQIQVFTEGGGQFVYQVQRVKKVPWTDGNDSELEKHRQFLGPEPGERLTLVTCGGANVWPWPARIYVVALPIQL
ncbi:MAG: class F sortase [Chloroflexota bacterium]